MLKGFVGAAAALMLGVVGFFLLDTVYAAGAQRQRMQMSTECWTHTTHVDGFGMSYKVN